MKFNKMQ